MNWSGVEKNSRWKSTAFWVDQLVMSYGMGGQIKKAHELLDSAVRQDPDYTLNYYNLACAFAEDGDKSKVLANLDLAFRWKANVLKGEQMPDPRSDSSFQKYVRDPDFVSLMKSSSTTSPYSPGGIIAIRCDPFNVVLRPALAPVRPKAHSYSRPPHGSLA